ncbi:EscU/YscU/HrcU family type III secretion system export apparatus switch protein [Fusibacter paucivorans]|uniref:EscU/YscU/HrcU family type III secretion system export apparatus switch protein n=1 Tax=Fusibacter paucivorans TaxID=76009 RepID=A0ABS5PTX9_9FIRM|nr:EscU/YscU/HrcU family type III secretion system export apparatus switch protein [Fusibacter paucivorans]MBS7527477.1 EscU/YscU/HrcU family type III secretion system export apparatus switch protein [Fusibacter paucivorans]
MDQKRKMASALKFNPEEDAAPQVVAKGIGLIAENIIEKAKASDVPIYVDEKLTNQLHQLEIGEQIPYELYEVVAEVLVFISKMDQKKK